LEIVWFSTRPSRALHRSGAALIAIADSVAEPMVEGADHDGARCPRPHVTASSDRKSRTVWRSFTFFEARSINFVIVVYSK